MVSSSSSSSESDSESGNVSDAISVAHLKFQGLAGTMGEISGWPISQAVKAQKHGSLILMIWQPEGAGTMRNV